MHVYSLNNSLQLFSTTSAPNFFFPFTKGYIHMFIIFRCSIYNRFQTIFNPEVLAISQQYSPFSTKLQSVEYHISSLMKSSWMYINLQSSTYG